MKVINFMGLRKVAALCSITLVLASIGSLAVQQLNWGLDFTGGTLVEVYYSETADLTGIRNTLSTEGYKGATVVSFGTDRDVLIRLPHGYSDQEGAALLKKLQATFSGTVELRRIEFVGPQVGDELREQGGLAMLLALGLVMLYIAFRFQLKFAVGAVVALIHDVIITLGFFSFTRMEFDLTVLAALLAVIGYSLNDTIVVFDRIRENFRKIRRTEPSGTGQHLPHRDPGQDPVYLLDHLAGTGLPGDIRWRDDQRLCRRPHRRHRRRYLLFNLRGVQRPAVAECQQGGPDDPGEGRGGAGRPDALVSHAMKKPRTAGEIFQRAMLQ